MVDLVKKTVKLFLSCGQALLHYQRIDIIKPLTSVSGTKDKPEPQHCIFWLINRKKLGLKVILVDLFFSGNEWKPNYCTAVVVNALIMSIC